MTRLQGSDWHNVKINTTVECFVESSNGNIAVFGKNIQTGESIYHWLNNEEKSTFDKTLFPEKKWEDIFPKKEKI